jgi:hypothetical protein
MQHRQGMLSLAIQHCIAMPCKESLHGALKFPRPLNWNCWTTSRNSRFTTFVYINFCSFNVDLKDCRRSKRTTSFANTSKHSSTPTTSSTSQDLECSCAVPERHGISHADPTFPGGPMGQISAYSFDPYCRIGPLSNGRGGSATVLNHCELEGCFRQNNPIGLLSAERPMGSGGSLIERSSRKSCTARSQAGI